MRKLFVAAALLIANAIPAFTQTPAKSPAADGASEQAVLKVTRDWLDAEEKHDRATLQRIIADDFQGTAPMGNTVFKEDVLPEEGTQRGLSLSVSDMKARVFGDTAVVSARGVQKSGEKRDVRITVIFAKRDDRWQMVAGHLSAVPRQEK